MERCKHGVNAPPRSNRDRSLRAGAPPARQAFRSAIGLLVLACCADAQRPPFVDDFAPPAPWRTNGDDSVVDTVEQPHDNARWGLRWQLPPVQPGIYFITRPLGVSIDETYVIRSDVYCSDRTALEVQLSTANDPRLWKIVHLERPGWNEIAVPVAEMGRGYNFADRDFGGPLFLRFWVDGGPGWANGGVPHGQPLVLGFANLSVTSPLEGVSSEVKDLLAVDPAVEVARVSPFVYGHFLEHIYHSVEDGLYGELVRNRAFYFPPEGFVVEDDAVVQTSTDADRKVFAGDASWTDYEFSLRARKIDGSDGFLVIFRARDDHNFYWWSLGGWGNTKCGLEREVSNLRRTITEPVARRIETGRWYSIRVRVNGDHVEGFLDDVKLLDAHDAAHPQGRVGVGTWCTRAEFRELRVTGLDGTPFPGSLLEDIATAPPTEDWTAYPPSKTPRVAIVQLPESPNSGWGARIELDPHAGPCGLAQKRFNVVAGHSYHGAAWIKGEGTIEQMSAAFVARDESILAAATPELEGEAAWVVCRFVLKPTRSDPDATLVLTAEGEGALVVDMVSLMRDDSLETKCRADLLEAVQGLKPTLIRWPGGFFASIYDWKRAIGPQHERKPIDNWPWAEADSAGFGTDEFIAFCQAVGAEPLLVMRLGLGDATRFAPDQFPQALEWIEYCNGDTTTPMGRLRAANGHPDPYNVRYWELDNETYSIKPEVYGARIAPLAQVIKQRWPDLTLFACGYDENGDRGLLATAGRWFDVLSVHRYSDPKRFADDPVELERLFSRYNKLIAEDPFPHVSVGLSEWGPVGIDWGAGMCAAGILNAAERQGLSMASPAIFIRRTDGPDWNCGWINQDYRGWFPSPQYVVMKLYRAHFQPRRLGLEKVGPLDAVAALSEDGKTLVLKVVNPTAEARLCAVRIEPGFKVRRAAAWQIRAGPEERNTMADPDRISPEQVRVDSLPHSTIHSFPSYSVTVLEFAQ